MIRQWKEDQAKRLEEKDRLEEEARLALKEHAKKELEDWYTQHAEQVICIKTLKIVLLLCAHRLGYQPQVNFSSFFSIICKKISKIRS